MEYEGINVRSQLCDQEGDLVGHKAADEVNVAAEAVQLGDRYVTPLFPCGCKGGLELRAAVEGVRAFTAVLVPRLQTKLRANDFEIKSASLIPLPVVSANQQQVDVQSTVNATIVSNGAFVIALQAAMRSAIINNKLGNSELENLVSTIATDVTAATAEGFSFADVKDGKAQTMKFVAIIADAIKREIASEHA